MLRELVRNADQRRHYHRQSSAGTLRTTGRMLLSAIPDHLLQQYLDDVSLTKFAPNAIMSKVKLRRVIKEVRLNGWSIVDQELEVGLRWPSVPIRDGQGQIVAALNVCCPVPAFPPMTSARPSSLKRWKSQTKSRVPCKVRGRPFEAIG